MSVRHQVRTQHINFFKLEDKGFLVDLPGYGYAKVPFQIRQHWDQLLGAYLETRQPLHGMVLIMDIRHPLTKLDRRMLDWFTPTGKACSYIAYKGRQSCPSTGWKNPPKCNKYFR